MTKAKIAPSGISFFETYLSIWVVLCMILGISLSVWVPQIAPFLSRFSYAQVSLPIAILLWLMIYPMMLKIDFQPFKQVQRNAQDLLL